MVSPVHSHEISLAAPHLEDVHLRTRQITFLALSILASFVATAILPWQLSFPLSTLFIGSALFYLTFSAQNNSSTNQTFVQEPIVIEERPLIHEIVHHQVTPVFIAPSPVYPIQRNPSHFSDGFSRKRHAPVGTGELSRPPIFIRPCSPEPVHAPVGNRGTRSEIPAFGNIGEEWLRGNRAPVGRR